MIEPFPEHWQLISFFESEPTEDDMSVPVAYRELTFRCAVSDEERVEVGIDRASNAVQMVWNRPDEESLRLHLPGCLR
jgi:hypothetical protein